MPRSEVWWRRILERSLVLWSGCSWPGLSLGWEDQRNQYCSLRIPSCLHSEGSKAREPICVLSLVKDRCKLRRLMCRSGGGDKVSSSESSSCPLLCTPFPGEKLLLNQVCFFPPPRKPNTEMMRLQQRIYSQGSRMRKREHEPQICFPEKRDSGIFMGWGQARWSEMWK